MSIKLIFPSLLFDYCLCDSMLALDCWVPSDHLFLFDVKIEHNCSTPEGGYNHLIILCVCFLNAFLKALVKEARDWTLIIWRNHWRGNVPKVT